MVNERASGLLSVAEAKERALAVLRDEWKAAGGWEPEIIYWEAPYREIGVRVSEVSGVRQNAGFAWMQSDEESWPVLMAVERYILELAFIGEDVDVLEDALRRAVRITTPEDKDRL